VFDSEQQLFEFIKCIHLDGGVGIPQVDLDGADAGQQHLTFGLGTGLTLRVYCDPAVDPVAGYDGPDRRYGRDQSAHGGCPYCRIHLHDLPGGSCADFTFSYSHVARPSISVPTTARPTRSAEGRRQHQCIDPASTTHRPSMARRPGAQATICRILDNCGLGDNCAGGPDDPVDRIPWFGSPPPVG